MPPFEEVVRAIAAVWFAFAAYYLCRVAMAIRDGIRFFIWKFTVSAAGGLIVYAALVDRGHRPPEPQAGGFFVALVLTEILGRRRRSRYIPAAVRRAVIARDLAGKPFDSSKHHLDHTWPFSRGGSHSADNLRVVDRKENLKKGARSPRFRDWLR